MHTHIIALAGLLALTLSFTGPAQPPQGTVFVGEVGPGTYSCAVVASRCVFNVDRYLWDTTKAICVYPKADPNSRQCIYAVELGVRKPPKRRSVRP